MLTILWVLGILLLTVVLCEGLLRVLKPELTGFFVLEPCQRKIFHIEPGIMPGVGQVATFRTNSKGMRAREFSRTDSYRFLVLGCSVAISQYVDQAKTWTAVLEQQLTDRTARRVWVGSVGRPENTARDILTYMRYLVPQYAADLNALIVFVGVNDLALMLSKRSDYNPDFTDHVDAEYRMRRAFERFPASQASSPLHRRMAMWTVASCVKHRLFKDTYYREGLFYTEKRQARRTASAMIEALPDLTPGLDEYERNLKAIIEQAQEYALRPIFLTIPSMWCAESSQEQESLFWFGWVAGSARYYAASILAQGIDMYNRRMRKVCDERGVECFDLAPAIPRDTRAFYDDVHLNEDGSRRIAEELGRYLLQRPPFGQAGSAREALS
jgi:lysophospholipase L1-like esterase